MLTQSGEFSLDAFPYVLGSAWPGSSARRTMSDAPLGTPLSF
jgi:hypothetical protein